MTTETSSLTPAAGGDNASAPVRAPEAYLITWNPESRPWETLQQDAVAVAQGERVISERARQWSISNNTQIQKGDRLFLMKQGKAPRGIMAVAVATSDSYEHLHWDPERAKNNETTRYVDLQFQALLDPDVRPLLEPSSLEGSPAHEIYWETPKSGVRVGSPEAVAALDAAWTAHLAKLAIAPAAASEQKSFLDVMRSYMEQCTIFQSTSQGRRYYVMSVNERHCVVHRVDANDSNTTISLASYQQRLQQIRDAGGKQTFESIDNTVSARMAFLQGPELGLSPDQDSILDLARPEVAAANLCATMERLEVDRSSGKPRLYKPALLAVIFEGIISGDLAENRILFDWVLPRFVAKLASLGITAGPEQAALAFYHLTSEQFWYLCYRTIDQLVDGNTISPSSLRDRVTHAILKETYWRALQDKALAQQVLDALTKHWWPEPQVDTQFWWVNQGKTYAEEHARGIVWAPRRNSKGTAMFHWTNVSLIRAGDVIFHYVDGEIRAISIAKTPGHAGAKLDGQPWEKEGWTADLDYHELRSPISLSAIGSKLAEMELQRSPINSDGRVNQGYMFGLPQEAAAVIAQALDPAGVPEAIMVTLPSVERRKPKFWAMGLGPRGQYWDECYKEGTVVVGGDFMADLRQFTTKADYAKVIEEYRDNDVDPVNDTLMFYQFCYEMQPGDYVVAKIGRDKILGIGRVTSDYYPAPQRAAYKHARAVEWIARKDLELPEAARVPTKTLTDVTSYERFMGFIRQHFFAVATPSFTRYTLEDALAGVFVPREEFVSILGALGRKKNVILAGAPGVGKTFIAKRLAYALMGVKDPARVEMVQFHQSYAYEDFIQGWRPDGDGGFFLKPGIFYEFVELAKRDTGKPYVFIIDEINRGNLSRIFGELLSLMEHDRRGADFAVPLTYAKDRSDRFYLPENLHLIGMMNTADRSLAMVDYALRRRFSFATLRPAFGSAAFAEFLKSSVTAEVLTKIVTRMKTLNEAITKDKNLRAGFAIGHSFFCPPSNGPVLGDDWYVAVVKSEIAPLIREYWFDDGDRAEEMVAELLK